MTDLQSYKYYLEKENSKHVNDKNFEYIILLEKFIKRIEKNNQI